MKKTPIPNSQNLNKSSTFPQISNEQPPQPIYNQIPIYYNIIQLNRKLWLFNPKNL